MGKQVGIQVRVRSQNNSRALENARNALREELWENFLYPDSVRVLTFTNFRARGALVHSIRSSDTFRG